MDLADHFRVIAHNWWRVLLVAVLVAGSVYYLSSAQDDVYEASTTMSVSSGLASSGSVSPKDQSVFLALTYAELALTRPVVAAAVKEGDIDVSVDDAEGRLEVEPASDTGFLTITAKAPRPREAAALANATAVALRDAVAAEQRRAIEQDLESVNDEIAAVQADLAVTGEGTPARAELETRYAALLQAAIERRTQPSDRVEVVSPARPPAGPVSPRPKRDALLAFLVAGILAAEASVAVSAFGDRLPRTLDAERVGEVLGAPVLTTVPRGTGPQTVEAFRALRTSLAALPDHARPRTLAIVSATENAGKSFTSINLAEAAAAQQSGVMLVDADLRRPVVHRQLQVERIPGLTDVLAGTELQGAVHSVGVSPAYGTGHPRRFLVLPSGSDVRDPVATLSNGALLALDRRFEEPPRLVIFDTPPVGLFADALAVASQCDAVIFVVDAKRSRLRSVQSAMARIERSGAKILGIVVNRVSGGRRDRYSAYR
jgi:capsular exopolysaccharide synthesis family protein